MASNSELEQADLAPMICLLTTKYGLTKGSKYVVMGETGPFAVERANCLLLRVREDDFNDGRDILVYLFVAMSWSGFVALVHDHRASQSR